MTSIKDFYNPDWFAVPDQSSIWVRIFTSLLIPAATFKQVIGAILQRVPVCRPPIAIAFGDFGGLTVPQGKFDIVRAETDGTTVIEMETDVRSLPKSNYIAFSTPYVSDGKTGNEPVCRRTTDVITALIRAHFGTNFLRQVVAEGELILASGQWRVASEGVAVPQRSEGPFLHGLNWNDVCEIADAINRQSPENKGRITLALEYLSKAFHDRDPFFSYWTALNVLCKGKNWQAIREKLMKCYGFKSQHDTELKTGVRVLGKWRNDFYHSGVKPLLTADLERYLQLMILDLVRFDLAMPLRAHIAGIRAAAGYDLSPIGLPNNRTKDQKVT